jgi:hypothetical protein
VFQKGIVVNWHKKTHIYFMFLDLNNYPQAILTWIYQTIGTIDIFHFSPKSVEQGTTCIPKVPKQNEPLHECKFPRFSFDMPNILTIYNTIYNVDAFLRLSTWPLGIFVTSTKHTHFYSCLWFYNCARTHIIHPKPSNVELISNKLYSYVIMHQKVHMWVKLGPNLG